jgi:hypothetical protein
VQCTGVSFLTDSTAGQDVVTINFNTLNSSQQEFYYFSATAFGTNSINPQDGGPFFSNASLTTTGITAAVPEPSTWAMMILGFVGIGAMTGRGGLSTAGPHWFSKPDDQVYRVTCTACLRIARRSVTKA